MTTTEGSPTGRLRAEARPIEVPKLPRGFRRWNPDTDTHTGAPPKFDPDTMAVGVFGEYLRALDPHTEATMPAVGAGILAATGAYIGRNIKRSLGRDERHFPNEFVAVVGRTSYGRKGMADSEVKWAMRNGITSDPLWMAQHTQGGFGSGEKFIEVMQDASRESDEMGNPVYGKHDQRVIVVEPELSRVFTVSNRESSIFSHVLREGFDNVVLRHLTNTHGTVVSTHPSISVFGSITPSELVATITEVSIKNGFANRFLWVWSHSEKLLPFGSTQPDDALKALVVEMGGNLAAVLDGTDPSQPLVMEFDEDTKALWKAEYGKLSKPGGSAIMESLLARGTVHATRLSMTLAALEGSKRVRVEDLRCALAWWKYSVETVQHVFGESVDAGLTDQVLRVLRMDGAVLSKRDIHNELGRNHSGPDVSAALRKLSDAKLIYEWKGEGSSKGGAKPSFYVAIKAVHG